MPGQGWAESLVEHLEECLFPWILILVRPSEESSDEVRLLLVTGTAAQHLPTHHVLSPAAIIVVAVVTHTVNIRHYFLFFFD